jgi:hypothetical protein
MRLADVVCSEGARNSSEAWSHFVGVDSLAKQASLPTIGHEETKGGGELRRDRSGRIDAFFCPAQPCCLSASLPLSLCRSRCDDVMRPTSSLRASHLVARGAPPVLCTCSRDKVSLKTPEYGQSHPCAFAQKQQLRPHSGQRGKLWKRG